MRLLALALGFATLLAKPLAAEELWACAGFVYADGSTGDPFILRGDGRTYTYTVETISHEIEYVAENTIVGFRIYVDRGRNTHRSAYYLRFEGDALTIRQLYWYFEPSESVCKRQ